MEFQMFHNRIKQMLQEAEGITSSIADSQHIERLRNLITQLREIELFFVKLKI